MRIVTLGPSFYRDVVSTVAASRREPTDDPVATLPQTIAMIENAAQFAADGILVAEALS
jgi:hypothetical protein